MKLRVQTLWIAQSSSAEAGIHDVLSVFSTLVKNVILDCFRHSNEGSPNLFMEMN